MMQDLSLRPSLSTWNMAKISMVFQARTQAVSNGTGGQKRACKLTSRGFGHASNWDPWAARHLLRHTAHAGVATCLLQLGAMPV